MPHARSDPRIQQLHTPPLGGGGGGRRDTRPPIGGASSSELPDTAPDQGFDVEPVASGFHNSKASQAVVRYSAGPNGTCTQHQPLSADVYTAVTYNFADVLSVVWQTTFYESMKNIWDGILSDPAMSYCDAWLRISCQLNLPSTVISGVPDEIDSLDSNETSSKVFYASDCDMDFPPGFEPHWNDMADPSTTYFSEHLPDVKLHSSEVPKRNKTSHPTKKEKGMYTSVLLSTVRR